MLAQSTRPTSASCVGSAGTPSSRATRSARSRSTSTTATSSAPGCAAYFSAWKRPRYPTPTTAVRSTVISPPPTPGGSCLHLRRIHRHDRDPGAIRERDHLLAVEDDGPARLDRERPALHLHERGDRGRADGGEVEARVLRRLADLHEHDVAVPELAGPPDRRVRPLDPLDRDDGAAPDDHALPDVELSDHLRGTEPEADVAPLLGARLARAEDAGRGHDVPEI